MASLYEKEIVKQRDGRAVWTEGSSASGWECVGLEKKLLNGEMAERLNAAVSKTVILGNRYREFESLSLRIFVYSVMS